MSGYELPTALEVGGVSYAIRTDWRDVLYLLGQLNDGEYEPDERPAVCLGVLYEQWESIPGQLWQEALDKAVEFLDGGLRPENGRGLPRLMDWEQDAGLIIPAVNRTLGTEIRAGAYMHWWTFLGAYMEIGESLFSSVLGIRRKKAKGKKLEKYEQEFYRENRALVDLRPRDQAADRARREALEGLFV